MKQQSLLIEAVSRAGLPDSDQSAWNGLDSILLDDIGALVSPPPNSTTEKEAYFQFARTKLTADIKKGIIDIPTTAWKANLAKTLVITLAHPDMSWAYPEEILIHAFEQMPPNIMTEIRFNLMEMMIHWGKVSAFKTLINREDLINPNWNAGCPLLTHAIKTNTPNSLEIAKTLITHGVNLNQTFDDHESCVGGYADGVNPALEYCVINGNLKILKLLVKNGAKEGLNDLVKRVINAPEIYPYHHHPNRQNQIEVLSYLEDINQIITRIHENHQSETSDGHILYQALSALRTNLSHPECNRDQLMQLLTEYKLVIKASAYVQGTFFIQPQDGESHRILQTFSTLPLAYIAPDMNRSLMSLLFSSCQMSHRSLSYLDSPVDHSLVDEVMDDPNLLSKVIAAGTTDSTLRLRATAPTFREMIPEPPGLFVAPTSTALQGNSQQAPDTDEQAHLSQNRPS
ncbi:MAG: hypothetical protein CMF51_02500 [Legionellales bacterium]|nr:hypothetical protein [Legionellales bacterium]